MTFDVDGGPISLLEFGVYAVVGYGSVLFVISLMIRDKFPEAPTQAIMRIVCVIPGILCLTILAFHTTATDAIVGSGTYAALVRADVEDDVGNRYGVSPPRVGIIYEITQNGALTVTYDTVTGSRSSSFDVSDPSELVRHSDGEVKYILIENPVTWIMINLTFILLLFVWVIYQFATLFMIIGKRP